MKKLSLSPERAVVFGVGYQIISFDPCEATRDKVLIYRDGLLSAVLPLADAKSLGKWLIKISRGGGHEEQETEASCQSY
jgi:hypothetical protein